MYYKQEIYDFLDARNLFVRDDKMRFYYLIGIHPEEYSFRTR